MSPLAATRSCPCCLPASARRVLAWCCINTWLYTRRCCWQQTSSPISTYAAVQISPAVVPTCFAANDAIARPRTGDSTTLDWIANDSYSTWWVTPTDNQRAARLLPTDWLAMTPFWRGRALRQSRISPTTPTSSSHAAGGGNSPLHNLHNNDTDEQAATIYGFSSHVCECHAVPHSVASQCEQRLLGWDVVSCSGALSAVVSPSEERDHPHGRSTLWSPLVIVLVHIFIGLSSHILGARESKIQRVRWLLARIHSGSGFCRKICLRRHNQVRPQHKSQLKMRLAKAPKTSNVVNFIFGKHEK